MADQPEKPQEDSGAASPGRNHLRRWGVPIILAVCLAVVAVDEWRDLRRIAFARRIASIAKQNENNTLSALTKALNGDVATVRPSETGTSIIFPHWTWLRLWVTTARQTDQITGLRLLYFSSEELSLDRPQDVLPHPGPRLALSLVLTGLGCALWKAVTDSERPPARPLRKAAVVCAALCVLAQVLLAALGCLRLAI